MTNELDVTLTPQEELRCRKRFWPVIKSIRHLTHFSDEELEALLLIFYKVTKRQQMDRSNFRKVMYSLLNVSNDNLIDRIFSAFDRPNKLVITMETWALGMSVFLRGTLEEKINFCFQVYDMMGDGYIKREQMFQALRNTVQTRSFDDDPDEIVKEFVEIIMKRMDQDHDGRLSLQDYKQSVIQNPTLLEAFGLIFPSRAAVYSFLTTFTPHVTTMHYKWFTRLTTRRVSFNKRVSHVSI